MEFKFALSVVVGCRACFSFGVVQSEGCFLLVLLGAEYLQGDNKIGDAGASSLGEGLKCNSSVQILDLVSCGV